MAGLFEKDFRLLSQKKTNLFIFLVIAVIMGFSVGGDFILAYSMIMALTLATSTISYDEYDNGFPFLMSLPITKKIYVAEKYLLVVGVMAVTEIFAFVLCVLTYVLKGESIVFTELLFSAVIIFLSMLMIVCVMIPTQIRFGAEKSRMALIVLMGICFVLAFGGKKILEICQIDISPILANIDTTNPAVMVLILLLIVLIVVFVSIFASNKIMDKREY